MLRRRCFVVAALFGMLLVGSAQGAGLADSLKKGTPDVKSVGPLAFGPEGILFIGDPAGAAIFAVDTGDRSPQPTGPFNVPAIDEKLASLLGTDAKSILINDMAVNPASGNAYLSVSRGKGPDAIPVLIKVTPDGKLNEVSLKEIAFAKAALPNAASGRGRTESITDLAFVDGRVFIAGLSNEEFASKLRAIPFPFASVDNGTSVEIFHGAHGKLETASPVRTFTHYKINGEEHLLAAYTCTPLVKFPVSALKAGEKVKGTTVAELGNRNRPLDMIVYQKNGKDYILMANSARGMMKIATDGIDTKESISKRISDKAGLTYETIAALKDVQQLDRLDKNRALVLIAPQGGKADLKAVDLP